MDKELLNAERVILERKVYKKGTSDVKKNAKTTDVERLGELFTFLKQAGETEKTQTATQAKSKREDVLARYPQMAWDAKKINQRMALLED